MSSLAQASCSGRLRDRPGPLAPCNELLRCPAHPRRSPGWFLWSVTVYCQEHWMRSSSLEAPAPYRLRLGWGTWSISYRPAASAVRPRGNGLVPTQKVGRGLDTPACPLPHRGQPACPGQGAPLSTHSGLAVTVPSGMGRAKQKQQQNSPPPPPHPPSAPTCAHTCRTPRLVASPPPQPRERILDARPPLFVCALIFLEGVSPEGSPCEKERFCTPGSATESI